VSVPVSSAAKVSRALYFENVRALKASQALLDATVFLLEGPRVLSEGARGLRGALLDATVFLLEGPRVLSEGARGLRGALLDATVSLLEGSRVLSEGARGLRFSEVSTLPAAIKAGRSRNVK
jgi:hypothetical protein